MRRAQLPAGRELEAAPRAPRGASPWPELIVALALFFNAGLAVINGNVTPIGRNAVVAVEMLISGLAALVIARHWRREMTPWALLIGAMLLNALVAALIHQTFSPKAIRDVILIPLFVMLGLASEPRRAKTVVLAATTVIVGIAVIEVFFTSWYAQLFNIQQYYINTRGFAEAAWYHDSGLFVSAVRPGEGNMLLASLQLHRISSTFLEPITMGSFCAVLFVFTYVFRAELSLRQTVVLTITCCVLLVVSDSRFAATFVLLFAIVAALAPRLPRGLAAVYLPAGIAASVLLIAFMGWQPDKIGFSGRLAFGIQRLFEMGGAFFLGDPTWREPDSGISNLFARLNVFMVAVVWLMVTVYPLQKSPMQTRMVHGAALYLALLPLVSEAFVSIKTAALVWYLFGVALTVDRVPVERTAPTAPGATAARPPGLRWRRGAPAAGGTSRWSQPARS